MKKVSYERARKILNQILIENNCLNEYFENIKNYNQGKTFVDKEKYEEGYDIIDSEFSWSDTPSGATFWCKVSTTFN